MSTLNDLLRQVEQKDAQLAADLRREVKALESRRAFGLNFERHVPETVELPGRPVRRGDKVRFVPERGEASGSADRGLWRVKAIRREEGERIAELIRKGQSGEEAETARRAADDLMVVAEFRDPIYPGLVATGKVERGGDKPYHSVIKAENFHALQALLYTHEGKVDAIYIDPPYNTGAKDWKYNNDYVDGEDAYRHSKWLAFMERRLTLAKRLLNPENSVLIVTIDEKEYLRLGLLLEQTFPEAQLQMISAVINPSGAKRDYVFSRTDEYIYFVTLGDAQVIHPRGDGREKEVRWWYLRRTDVASKRGTVKGGKAQFYPIFIDENTSRIKKVGKALSPSDRIDGVPEVPGCIAVFPIRDDGLHMNWGLTAPTVEKLDELGLIRITSGHEYQPYILSYLSVKSLPKLEDGRWQVRGEREDGSKIVVSKEGKVTRATTAWATQSHDAGQYGSQLLRHMLAGRHFPFPKSLYAVEDVLRFFTANNPDAIAIDFFAGSGTTAHAVMRLNKQDGGRRQCISITNNEVSAGEQKGLRKHDLRPGDAEWEKLGICDYITQPRIKAAITGKTPEGEPIKGDYKFTDEFPMADGFEENVEFFTLTYEAPRPVAHHKSFPAIAPLLWLRAGAQGRRIEQAADDYAVADTYAVLFDLDSAEHFLAALAVVESVELAFIVTDDDLGFQTVCGDLPERIEAVRLYESYLTNFTINTGRG